MEELKAWKQFFLKLREQVFSEQLSLNILNVFIKVSLKYSKQAQVLSGYLTFYLIGKQNSLKVLVRIVKLILIVLTTP